MRIILKLKKKTGCKSGKKPLVESIIRAVRHIRRVMRLAAPTLGGAEIKSPECLTPSVNYLLLANELQAPPPHRIRFSSKSEKIED